MVLASETLSLPRRGFRLDPTKALIASAACWLGFAIMVWAVTTGHTQTIDRFGLLFWRDAELHPRGPSRLLELVRDVTALGGVILRNIFALMAVAALMFLRLRREAVLLGLTVALGWIVNSGVKLVVGRERPEIVPHLMEASGMSFPSGHSFNAAVVFIAIAIAFAPFSARQTVRVSLIATAMAGSLAVAWSRVWLGVHFPSDVIAGWLGGAGWAFAASALLYRPARYAVDRGEEFTAEHTVH